MFLSIRNNVNNKITNDVHFYGYEVPPGRASRPPGDVAAKETKRGPEQAAYYRQIHDPD
jgi:hypothetical protein